MTIAPLLPLPWIVLLVGAALVVTVICRPWRWATVMRIVAVLAIGAVLVNPVHREADAGSGGENGTPKLWVIVDDSASMGTVDTGRSENRFDRVLQQVGPWAAAARGWWIGADVQPRSQQAMRTARANGEQSRLIEGMRQLVAMAEPGTRMMLASDGHDTTDSGGDEQAWREVGEAAAAKDVRIDTWLIGGAKATADGLHITLTGSPTRAFVGQRVTMTAVMERDDQRQDDRPARVRLVRDSDVVQEAVVRWRADERVTHVTFTDVPFDEMNAADWRVYEARTDDAASQPMAVSNRGRAISVLMLVGEPTMASRLMIDALRRDDHVRLTVEQAITDQRVSVSRYHAEGERDEGKVDSLQRLMAFDAVVAGPGANVLVDQAWLDAYGQAHRGGVIGMVAGDVAAVMRDATGDAWANYRARVTAAVMNAAGLGGDAAPVEVWTEPVNATAGETVRVWVNSRAGVTDAGGRVSVIDAAGHEQLVTMSRDSGDATRMHGRVTVEKPGLARVRYEGREGRAQTAVMVRAESDEQRDVTSRPEGMRAMAAASGGAVLDGLSGWEPDRDVREPVAAEQAKMEPVLLRWEVMTAIVMLLGGAWIVRRLRGER